MSVAIKFHRLIPSAISEPTPSTYRPQIAEAPDCGGHACEAPESYQGRAAEAPDAGYGRSPFTESQFTHGRSQS